MPPKKRERENDSSKNRTTDQYQADHNLFLNAFEKPTQIYRFLRTRNMISPIFLHRTLTYMKQRMSRDHKARKGFKVNNLLKILGEKSLKTEIDHDKRFMTLTFLGFFDKTLVSHSGCVKVETSVTKISHKKRKDSSSPSLFVGTSEVPVNPSDDHPPSKAPIISIPSESFNNTNGNSAKSYVLFLKVAVTDSDHHITSNNDLDTLEPSAKRPKKEKEDVKYYGSELTVYDKQNRCLLVTGDYELGLQEIQNSMKISPKKNSMWVTMESTYDEAFEVFSNGPVIKFRLDWTSEPNNGWVERPKPLRPNGQSVDVTGNKENRPEKCTPASKDKGKNKTEPQKLQIVYQFLYNNNTRQQTEACDDFICPWCTLNCITLYSLLKHLKLCHSRFTFTYNQIPQGARIDIAINECYDGSYTGSPHDLISQPPGFAFSRNGPVRRTSVTNILVCRPKRPRPSLSEFLELEENDFDGQRPFITGHNRLYHHTTTCLPVYPKEMDIDSEGENDPKWLQQKTIMMIDDFTDVNEGEKELMKLWNLHVMKHGYVGDCQIPLACHMFLITKGEELLRKNLYRNFVLHICNLFDFGLISSATVYNIIRQCQEFVKNDPEAIQVLKDTWVAQMENWLASGGQGGAQDKAGSNFVFFPPKTEQSNPKATSSSTFISGDGTLKRKMTQQTPNSKQSKSIRNDERRNSDDSKKEDSRRKKEDEGTTEKRKLGDSNEKTLRKRIQYSPPLEKSKKEDDNAGHSEPETTKKKLVVNSMRKRSGSSPPRKLTESETAKKKLVNVVRKRSVYSPPRRTEKTLRKRINYSPPCEKVKKDVDEGGHSEPEAGMKRKKIFDSNSTRKMTKSFSPASDSESENDQNEKANELPVRRKSASNVDNKSTAVSSSIGQFRRKSTACAENSNSSIS